MIHLHLDPLGGLAGDMFAACVLAAFPELEEPVARAVHAAAGTTCSLVPHDDGVLAGRRFVVLGPDGRPADATPHAHAPHDHHGPGWHDHAHGHGHDHDHSHAPGQAHDAGGAQGETGAHGPARDHAHRDGAASDAAHAHGASGIAQPSSVASDVHRDDHASEHGHEHGASHDHGDQVGRAAAAERDSRHGVHADAHDHAGVHAGAHDQAGVHVHDHHHDAGHADPHGAVPSRPHVHRAWRDIRDHLQHCGLPDPVREHAIGIFAVLAEAEARVHGKPVDAVTFHEVGNADSIADIVAAAVLIHGTGAGSWSVSALPLGGGRVRTAHGSMPVPAPATVLLLDGFETIDDGVGGERVTPTGAAILCYLGRSGLLAARPSGRLGASGIGFGTRRLPGLSNCVRLLRMDTTDAAAAVPGATADPLSGTPHRTLAVIGFEIDDQSGEDLAAGLDRVRAMPGVHDVVQMMAVGKKGRVAIHVQVLAAPDDLEAVVAACFSETTTIGLRTHIVQGRALSRRSRTVEIDGAPVSVKLVRRPDGDTGKAEADHVLGLASHAARDDRRRRAVSRALRPVEATS